MNHDKTANDENSAREIRLNCPQCGLEISERNLNPSLDLAYCDHCQAAHSYQELLTRTVEGMEDIKPTLPQKSRLVYTIMPDGTERVKIRNFVWMDLSIVLFDLAAIPIFVMEISRGDLSRLDAALNGMVITLLTIGYAWASYNVVTLDATHRLLTVKLGPIRKRLDLDSIEEIELTEMPLDNFNSIRGYELHVVMQNGDELQITGAM